MLEIFKYVEFDLAQVIFARYVKRLTSCLGCRKDDRRTNLPTFSVEWR